MKTTEELKQEAIKKAYGGYWERLKDNICSNGYITEYQYYKPSNIGANLDIESLLGEDNEMDLIRPKSLAGIETNNGWILLDRRTTNEITYKGDIWIENKSGEIIFVNEDEFVPLDFAVAYQPVSKPKKRVY